MIEKDESSSPEQHVGYVVNYPSSTVTWLPQPMSALTDQCLCVVRVMKSAILYQHMSCLFEVGLIISKIVLLANKFCTWKSKRSTHTPV
jgi:hypothetical protein